MKWRMFNTFFNLFVTGLFSWTRQVTVGIYCAIRKVSKVVNANLLYVNNSLCVEISILPQLFN